MSTETRRIPLLGGRVIGKGTRQHMQRKRLQTLVIAKSKSEIARLESYLRDPAAITTDIQQLTRFLKQQAARK